MKATAAGAHSTERLEPTWRSSILPLLQEHHYGEWENVQGRYQLSSLLAAIAPAPAPADTMDSPAPAVLPEAVEEA